MAWCVRYRHGVSVASATHGCALMGCCTASLPGLRECIATTASAMSHSLSVWRCGLLTSALSVESPCEMARPFRELYRHELEQWSNDDLASVLIDVTALQVQLQHRGLLREAVSVRAHARLIGAEVQRRIREGLWG